jgi:diadenosine tetraphosphate (Ap4A) HIT family hydrolase
MTNCVLCKEALNAEEGQLIWRGDDCRVILVNDPDLPGFCRVIWNRHVAEMTDLTYGEREHIMSLVFAVEEAVRHVMQPDKINIATLGNMVPHIHWHIIPRYQDDVYFPGSVWSDKIQATPALVLQSRVQKAGELSAGIREAVSRLN